MGSSYVKYAYQFFNYFFQKMSFWKIHTPNIFYVYGCPLKMACDSRYMDFTYKKPLKLRNKNFTFPYSPFCFDWKPYQKPDQMWQKHAIRQFSEVKMSDLRRFEFWRNQGWSSWLMIDVDHRIFFFSNENHFTIFVLVWFVKKVLILIGY